MKGYGYKKDMGTKRIWVQKVSSTVQVGGFVTP